MRLLRLVALAASLSVLLAALPARAQSPLGGRPFGTDEAPPPGAPTSGPRVVMRLSYTAAAGCPEEQAIRTAITTEVRLWDPFAPNAPWRLQVVLERAGAGYKGQAELRDVTGAVQWTRVLAPRARCFDLVEDLAVTLALKINPPAPAPPAEIPLSPPPQPPGVEQPAPAPAASRVAVRVAAGTWADLATAPRPAFGLTAEVGVRIAWFSIAGGIRWDPPAGATMADHSGVSTTLVLGTLAPCAHVSWFAGCLAGELGQFRGSVTAAGVSPDHAATFYGRGGARLGVEIPAIKERLFVRLAGNFLGAPMRPALRLVMPGKSPVVEWESPAFTGGLGADLVAAF